jgi:hypothetical protein
MAPPLTPGVRCNRTMTERLSLQDAARELGITPDALRQRIRRGQYRSEKSEGRVYVYLDTDRTETEHDVHPPPESKSAALISELRSHVEDLRTQLEQAHERDRENRRIIAVLTQRIPELPAASSERPPDAPVTPADTPAGGRRDEEITERRSWWRRVFGG